MHESQTAMARAIRIQGLPWVQRQHQALALIAQLQEQLFQAAELVPNDTAWDQLQRHLAVASDTLEEAILWLPILSESHNHKVDRHHAQQAQEAQEDRQAKGWRRNKRRR